MSDKFKGDVIGMRVIGQHGGANGNFFGADFLHANGKIYHLYTDSRGILYFNEAKHKPSTQSPLSRGYDINGSVISFAQGLGNGDYRNLKLTNLATNQSFNVEGTGGIIIEIYPSTSNRAPYEPLNEPSYGPEPPEYRKKKVIPKKPKRKVCRCKKWIKMD